VEIQEALVSVVVEAGAEGPASGSYPRMMMRCMIKEGEARGMYQEHQGYRGFKDEIGSTHVLKKHQSENPMMPTGLR
jgi:hypothetical protein